MAAQLSDSILTTIKKLLGIEAEYTQFDPDVIININAAIMTLRQLGVGPQEGFSIDGDEQTWQDLLGDSLDFESAKTYIFLKTKIVFDPPSSSYVLEAYKEQIKEAEWRLMEQADPAKFFEESTE